ERCHAHADHCEAEQHVHDEVDETGVGLVQWDTGGHQLAHRRVICEADVREHVAARSVEMHDAVAVELARVAADRRARYGPNAALVERKVYAELREAYGARVLDHLVHSDRTMSNDAGRSASRIRAG